jgi:mannosyltransferase OCH1-like enzyme
LGASGNAVIRLLSDFTLFIDIQKIKIVMITYNTETPVLLVVQGKLDKIPRIYCEILQVKPQRLYLFFNAPENKSEEKDQGKILRLFKKAAWSCQVKTVCSKKHLTYNGVMQKALGWFFHREEEGIILDGFIVPSPAFFAFCSCLLEKYRHDERIGCISGQDMLKTKQKSKTNDSYYFSRLMHRTSLWATWRRVWKDMDRQMKTFPAFKKLNIMEDIPTHKPFEYTWSLVNQHELDWDAKFEYLNLINNRMAVVPNIHQLPANEYELPEINHPVFMVNPLGRELLYQEEKYSISAVTANEPDGMTFLRDKLLSFGKEAEHRMKIPRIIHQIYEDPAGPPPELLQIAETWKEHHPTWEYRFWGKREMEDFLETVCPEFKPYYYSYPFNVQRWDSIRYLILYHIGGLYVDFDYECLQPLDVLLADSTCCMGMEPTVNCRVHQKSLIVGNALMAAKPKHPYMAAIIEDMKVNFPVDYKREKAIQVMESTGPFMVTRVYEQLKRKKSVTLLPADCVAPLTLWEVTMLRAGKEYPEVIEKMEKAFAIHYFFGTWTDQTAEGK